MMNVDKLKDEIKDRGYSVIGFLHVLEKNGVNMSKNSYYRKLKGETEYTRSEILGIKEVLGLSNDEVEAIFFNDKVS